MFFHINHGMARKKRKNNIIIYVYDEFALSNATSEPKILRLEEKNIRAISKALLSAY